MLDSALPFCERVFMCGKSVLSSCLRLKRLKCQPAIKETYAIYVSLPKLDLTVDGMFVCGKCGKFSIWLRGNVVGRVEIYTPLSLNATRTSFGKILCFQGYSQLVWSFDQRSLHSIQFHENNLGYRVFKVRWAPWLTSNFVIIESRGSNGLTY